jgi:hypothetical protein
MQNLKKKIFHKILRIRIKKFREEFFGRVLELRKPNKTNCFLTTQRDRRIIKGDTFMIRMSRPKWKKFNTTQNPSGFHGEKIPI